MVLKSAIKARRGECRAPDIFDMTDRKLERDDELRTPTSANDEKFDSASDGAGSTVPKERGESISSNETAVSGELEGDETPTMSRMPTATSIPASVMDQSMSGNELEKGPTGPRNRTIDEEGKIVVNWVSRHDPENPKNWPRKKKIFNVVIISLMTFLCPLCSSVFVRYLYNPG